MHQFDSPETTVVTLAEQGGGEALDLGCGEGRNTLYLAQKGFRVTAVDTDGNALEKLLANANQRGLRPRIKVEQCHAFEVPPGEWHAIVACLIFHRLNRDEGSTLLTRMQMYTRTSGMNAVIGWTGEGEMADQIRTGKPDAFFLDKELILDRYRQWRRHTLGTRREHGTMIQSALYQKPR